jgi:hypothetical protein
MRNRRLIGVLLALPGFLGFGPQALAQAAPPIPEGNAAINSAAKVDFLAGECALFVWSGYPLRLMYISQANTRQAYIAQQGIKRYAVNPQGGADKFGQYAAQDLLDGVNTPSQLRLDSPAEFYKSVAYSAGTLTRPGSDGWLSIETAKAVATCNETEGNRAVRLNEAANGFDEPEWLETPTRLATLQPPPSPQATILIPEAAPDFKSGPEALPELGPELSPEPDDILEPQIILNAEVSPSPQPENKEIPAAIQVTQANYQTITTPKIASVGQTVPSGPARAVSIEPAQTIPPVVIADTPPGYMVQIGAFPNEAIAQQKWGDYQDNIDFLEQSQSIVQVAAVEDIGVVYRLRITGLATRKKAATLCQRLKSTGVDCFVPRD